MPINKLHILGKVSDRIQEKMGVNRSHKPARREWFFVDYIWKTYPVGTVFDIFMTNSDNSDWKTEYKAKVVKVTDEYGSDFEEIPAGYKTICCFEFSPEIPDEIKGLSVLNGWSERSKSVYLCQLDEIRKESNQENRNFIFLLWKELKHQGRRQFKPEDIAKVLSQDFNKNKSYFWILTYNLIQQGKAKEKDENRFELVE